MKVPAICNENSYQKKKKNIELSKREADFKKKVKENSVVRKNKNFPFIWLKKLLKTISV